MTRSDIPFTILVLAPFRDRIESGPDSTLIEIDLFDLDEAIKTFKPSFRVPMPRELCPEGAMDVNITDMKGFKPEVIVNRVDYLARLVEARKWADDSSKSGKPLEDIIEEFHSRWPGIPVNLTLTQKTKKAPSATRKLDQILNMVDLSSPENQAAPDVSQSKDLKSQLDELLSSSLKILLDNDTFRAHEAAWRGLQVLLKQGVVKRSHGTLVKAASINKDSLESVLTRLVGELAAKPPGLALVDLPFDNSPYNIELLQKVAWFSEALMIPTVAWVDAGIFHLESWSQLGKLPRLGHHLEGSVFSKLRKLRKHPGAGWIALTCNRFLARLPYGPGNQPKGVVFREEMPCWLSPVWAAGALIAQSVEKFGWPNRFSEYQSIRLSDLPLFSADKPGPSTTEMQLSEDRLHQFVEAGFSPLVGPIKKDVAFMPKNTCLSGDSFQVQLLVSQVVGILFWCQQTLEQESLEGDLAGGVQKAFAVQWQKTGHPVPEDLKIIAGDPDQQGFVPLSIELTPPTSVFSPRQKLAFGFRWSKSI